MLFFLLIRLKPVLFYVRLALSNLPPLATTTTILHYTDKERRCTATECLSELRRVYDRGLPHHPEVSRIGSNVEVNLQA